MSIAGLFLRLLMKEGFDKRLVISIQYSVISYTID